MGYAGLVNRHSHEKGNGSARGGESVKGFPNRELVPQEFINFALSVPLTPGRVPISVVSQSLETQLYDAMILSVHSTALKSIYLGQANVTAGIGTNGLQIRPGIPVQLSIRQPRQLYELQRPLVMENCEPGSVVSIPNVVWDVSNMFLTTDTGGAAVSVAILLFKIPAPFR